MLWGGYEYWRKRQEMSEQEIERKVEVVEIDSVTSWRFGYLCGCGFDPGTALKLAESSEVDLRRVDHLLEKGCPHNMAVEILL
jgi:hypothetical protein